MSSKVIKQLARLYRKTNVPKQFNLLIIGPRIPPSTGNTKWANILTVKHSESAIYFFSKKEKRFS